VFLSKRNGVYYLWYHDDGGRKRKVSTGARVKSEAMQFLRHFEEASHPQRKRHTLLSAFTNELFGYVCSNMTSGTLWIYKSAFRHFIMYVGDIPLQSLTPYHLDRFKTYRLKDVSPVTVNIELRCLKAGIAVARRWKIIDCNPCENVSAVSVPQREPVFYTKSDFSKLMDGIKEEWLRCLVLWSALTGMRQGESLSLRWRHVDLDRGVVHIESGKNFKTKAGKRRTIPISSAGVQLLRLLPRQNMEDCVFTLNGNCLHGQWVGEKVRRYVRSLGLNRKLNFHSLRHSFASWLAMDGVSIYQISRLLGHSDVSVTQEFYAHLQPEDLRESVQRIDQMLNRNWLPSKMVD
jgi:integrase